VRRRLLASTPWRLLGVKVTCCTDGRSMDLLYMDPANIHDVAIVKRNRDEFAARFMGCRVLLDKGYIDGGLAQWMEERGVNYVAVKRRNMVKSREELLYYRVLNRVRRLIETRFSQLEEYGLRYVRAISRRSLAIKIIVAILVFNIYQLMEAT
jgi:hypothetical protein